MGGVIVLMVLPVIVLGVSPVDRVHGVAPLIETGGGAGPVKR